LRAGAANFFKREKAMSNVAVIDQQRTGVIDGLARHYSMEKGAFLQVMKATIMKGANISNEDIAAFCLVAKEHGLNPFTKEIFAFPTGGGIQPIVSVDGWMKLINAHPDFDGMEFVDEMQGEKLVSITCKMFRKGRAHPVSVTEYMSECFRPTPTWKQWPARMLRHKAAIQAARYAFGFAGIMEPDEAERMADVRVVSGDDHTPMITDQRKQRCDDAAEQYAPSVEAIKAHIANDDWTGMTECWSEIPQAAQMDLYLAPSKGGVFTTHERKCIKERQVREQADNPDFPLESN
jgi:phage recombination protein Bet